MDLTEYFARKLFVRAVDWLSKYETIKSKGVNEAYCISQFKIKKMSEELKKDDDGQIKNPVSRFISESLK